MRRMLLHRYNRCCPQRLLLHVYQACTLSTTKLGGSSSCWERTAEQVKNTDTNTNPYLEAIRKTHDPTQHIKTIEEELKSTIGQALGKQGAKILRSVRAMQDQLQRLESCDQQERQTIVKAYHHHREQALTARWELTVHRQAAGCIIGNHQYVQDAYPIPGKLVYVENNKAAVVSKPEKTNATKKNITGQLDWWENIGRWR